MLETNVFKGRLLNVFRRVYPNGADPVVKEIVRKKPAVFGLVYDPVRDAVAFVRQEREPFKSPLDAGIKTEVPAGHIEADELPRDTIKKEVREEIGVDIRRDQSLLLNNESFLAVSPGWTDELSMPWFVRIEPGQCNDSRTVFGAAEEHERTELEWIPIHTLSGMTFDDLKSWGIVHWFLYMRLKGDARCRP
ncbi:MAG: NUDIX domain-containing protein [bacterium]|nr:NUDIX domain-containing protein [bacterium]